MESKGNTGRPIGDLLKLARQYGVSKRVIGRIGLERFNASSELARRIYINAHNLRRNDEETS